MTVLLLVIIGMAVGCKADSPTVPGVGTIEPPPRLLVPGGAEAVYQAGDTVTFVAHDAAGSAAPSEVISATQTAVSRWNNEVLDLDGHTNNLPHFNPSVIGGTSAPGTIARIVYADECTGGDCGYCGSFNGEVGGVREISLKKKNVGDTCGGLGRVVDDLTGVITHEISHVFGFAHQSDPQTVWCVTNVPDEGNLNPHLCRWEIQSVYAAYGLRTSDPKPSVTIANRIVILPNPDTVLTGSSKTVTAHGIVDPEPSQNVDAGGDPETPWVLPPDTITIQVDWDEDSPFFSVNDLGNGDARIDGIQIGQAALAVVAEDHADDFVTAVFPWPVDTATIVVESGSGLNPCFQEDATNTWRATDQYLTTGCGSTGGNIEYRWRFQDGGQWTAFSPDTIHEFFGHSSAATFNVTLEVKDTSTGATEQFSKTFDVLDAIVSMSGPTWVTNKEAQTYESTWAGKWYERYDPENLYDWELVLGLYRDYSEYTRIWPAGEYTTRVRVEVTGSGYIGRDWLDVVVCHESISGCGVQFLVMPGQGEQESLPLFGGGPWIASGDEFYGFYDLTGAHEEGSPFSSAEWLNARGVQRTSSSDGRVGLSWEVVSATEDTRIVEFVVDDATGAYTFGLALDPDLGSSPADDQSLYDPTLGILVAFDGTEAMGFALRRDGLNGLTAAKQYGARRFAPRDPRELRRASRESGVDLASDADDVQFLLAGSEVAGTQRWTLLMARGADQQAVLTRLKELMQ